MKSSGKKPDFEPIPNLQAFYTSLVYIVLNIFGHLRDFLRKIGIERRLGTCDPNGAGFAPLFSSYEGFYFRNVYIRLRDCVNRPICSVPGAEIEIIERKSDDHNWTFHYTGRTTKALNMGSYNYLGFAENDGPCSKAAIQSIGDYGLATCSSRQEFGSLQIHNELEALVAEYLGVEDSVAFGMGFATNSLNIAALVDRNCLILSDELNHSSIVLGSRLSGAVIKVFKHNDMDDLRQKLRNAVIEGHPTRRRAWAKILIIVEGVYSMEGTIVNLPEIVALKKEFKAYLFLDEAHSIGAVGSRGRGVVDHWGCDPRDIDVLMGTFTKSFGSAGGYIAGSKRLIDFVRVHSIANCYASSMSAPITAQIIRTLAIVMTKDGTGEGAKRIAQLAQNSRYFRDKLVKMGFIVYGDDASPVVPVMLYLPSKIAVFNQEMLDQGIAVVTVGFPATGLYGARVRFCMSAAHTRQMLDKVLEAMDNASSRISIRYSQINEHRSWKQVQLMD